ncbi:MAG: hypothetical protein WC071_10535 [Victivallaceae bacterium]
MNLSPRFKPVIITASVFLPLLAVLVFFCFGIRREALSPSEIVEKKDWNKDELTGALSRTFLAQSDKRRRHEVLEHLRKQLSAYPENERREIRIKALTNAMNGSLDQLRAATPEDRAKIMDEMNKAAESNYQRILKMSPQQKESLKKQLSSEEGKAVSEEATKIMTTRLAPDERRMFATISQIWIRTLKEL